MRAYDLEQAEENLQGLLRALDAAGAAGAQLVALPECAYPAYYVRDADPYARAGVRPFAEVAALFGAKAREHGYWLAAGMAVPHEDGALTNSGVVFDPRGELVGRYDKSFLWHFDNAWFRRGEAFPVFDAGFVRFGVLICADGRQPEIARSLAVNGTEVILDLTAWVSWASSVAQLSTSQCEYLMPVRACENGVWVAAADKWGPEDGTLIYAGRSCVIDPQGETRTTAASEGDATVTYVIDPADAPPETVPRRPSLYARLTKPWEAAPAKALLAEPLVPAEENRRIAIVPSEDELFAPGPLIARYQALRAQDCDLTVFAGAAANDGWQVALPAIEQAVREHGGALAFAAASSGCTSEQAAVLVTPSGTVEHRATHGRGIDLGETNAPVTPTAAGNVALLCGDEGRVPEVARCLCARRRRRTRLAQFRRASHERAPCAGTQRREPRLHRRRLGRRGRDHFARGRAPHGGAGGDVRGDGGAGEPRPRSLEGHGAGHARPARPRARGLRGARRRRAGRAPYEPRGFSTSTVSSPGMPIRVTLRRERGSGVAPASFRKRSSGSKAARSCSVR